ncbi:MAG: 3'(2'),5'-bisphosphate nucleotidase CysQ [Alphaproteobacteria bacterium]|nr:3'(2'),5'-bisphosphate nucleotidase CysQ [Alphaproteobacteria bacterium]
MDLDGLIDPVIALARAAAKAALVHYGPRPNARSKDDGSPVTDADEASEALIVAGLRELTPEIAVVSEEEMAAGRAPFAGGGGAVPSLFWLVDPLDGTREFVARNGEFSINIGLVRDGRPVFGVLLAPIGGHGWAAAGPGRAIAFTPDGTKRSIRVRTPPASGLVVLSSRSHGDDAALDAYLDGRPIAARRRLGSALKFGALAAGEADLYPRFGPTSEWDTCAGHAILEAAGGRVETAGGQPLRYGKPGFRNPDFIARGG